MTTIRVITALTLGLAAGGVCSAVELPPELKGFEVGIKSETDNWSSELNPESITEVRPGDKAGTYVILGGWGVEGQWDATWEINVDLDPGVTSSFNITNPTGATSGYAVTVTVPIAPLGGPTVMEGKMSGNLLDANLDGSATVSTIGGGSLYSALVDALAPGVHTEYDAPYSLTTTDFIDPLPLASWGPIPGPAVASFIGISNAFSLTGGDTFQMVNVFVINAIPAPGAMAVAGLAGLCAIRRRR